MRILPFYILAELQNTRETVCSVGLQADRPTALIKFRNILAPLATWSGLESSVGEHALTLWIPKNAADPAVICSLPAQKHNLHVFMN